MDDLEKLKKDAGIVSEAANYDNNQRMGELGTKLKLLREDFTHLGLSYRADGDERLAQGIAEVDESLQEAYKILQHIMADVALGQFKRN